jgi:hypothetical protein
MPKTPAPTTADMARAKDTAYGRTAYGGNAYAGRVVADPGKSVSSPLADELKRVNAQGDGGDALQTIIERGAHGGPDWQTRDIGNGNVPTHPDMRGASPGPKVPAKTGFSESQPVRKP